MDMIKTHGGSDYGLYGKDGKFTTDRLPVSKCKCLCGPIIECEYDDEPGFRETTYEIKCEMCKKTGGLAISIDGAIRGWNELD